MQSDCKSVLKKKTFWPNRSSKKKNRKFGKNKLGEVRWLRINLFIRYSDRIKNKIKMQILALFGMLVIIEYFGWLIIFMFSSGAKFDY